MKLIPKLRKHNYLTRIGIFLIAIALIAGTVSCEGDGNGNGAVKYSLTMAANPAAGGTATDLTGGSPYTAGTVVNIQASANPGYSFVSWSAPAGAFGSAVAATTTFTMPAQNVTVTANFVGPPDHFEGYWASNVTEWLPIDNVYLEDQFGAFNATVGAVWGFANPAAKQHEGNETQMWNPDHHFTVYDIMYGETPQEREVEVDNQFGVQNLTVYGPVALAVPTQKEGHQSPVNLDHYLLYWVDNPEYQGVAINLTDQFEGDPEVLVLETAFFANPVKKTYKGNVTEIVNPDVHGVIYTISGAPFGTVITVDNQFGNQTLNVSDPAFLVVPSEKLAPPVPPLDDFKCYNVTGAIPVMDVVDVMDQFDEYHSVMVLEALWFCNPVEKWHNGQQPIENPDNHLTVYNITGVSQGTWYVEVYNQMLFEPQNLTVYGPVALAAPTWKLDPGNHTPPKYLDHYLLYEVVAGLPVNQMCDLIDQFQSDHFITVTLPRYFANPVLYKYHNGNYTGVWDPETHLVFYEQNDISANQNSTLIFNQFEYKSLNLTPYGQQLLASPSVKLYYEYLP
jgi:hypothetical protein